MARHLVFLATLLFASVAIAGCTGDSVDSGDDADGPDAETRGQEAEATHRFTDSEATNESFQESGSVSFADHCFAFGCAAADMIGDDRYDHVIDLTESIPAGVHTYVEAAFQSEGGSSMNLEAPHVIWSEQEFEEGRGLVLKAMVFRFDASESIEIVLTPQIPSFQFPVPQQETEWTLDVELETLPGHVPGGSAVLLPLDPGTTGLNITTVDGGEVELLSWTGDGVYLGRNATDDGKLRYPIPENATSSGEIIFYVKNEAGLLQFNATGPDPAAGLMRVLPIEWNPIGSPQPLETTGTTTWSFEVDEHPLAVGIVIEFDDGVDNANTVIRVSSPRSMVLEAYVSCTICIGYVYQAQSTSGNADHVAGTYTVTAESSINTSIEVETFAIMPAR